jgi:hypothetical protein
VGGWGDGWGSPKFSPGWIHVGFGYLRTEQGRRGDSLRSVRATAPHGPCDALHACMLALQFRPCMYSLSFYLVSVLEKVNKVKFC